MFKIETSLNVGSETAQTSLFTPESPNGSAAMFTHGYAASRNRYAEFAEACAELGTTALTVDLLSHGQSSGNRENLTVSNYVEGVETAYDYLASRPEVDSTRIGAMGGSFGAYLLVLLSSRRPIESLLLRVPALYPDELQDKPRSDFDTDAVLRMKPNPDNSALQLVHKFAGKVLLVSSKHDEVIMPETISAYEQALNNGEHIPMADATHVLDKPNRQIFLSLLKRWVAEL
jgi:hypothetical protein